MVTADRFRNRLPRGGDPEAAPRQLPLEIGEHLAVGRNDEADQLVDRPHLAADRAHPIGRGLGRPRSKIEVGVSVSKHAAGISLTYAGVSASASAGSPG